MLLWALSVPFEYLSVAMKEESKRVRLPDGAQGTWDTASLQGQYHVQRGLSSDLLLSL